MKNTFVYVLMLIVVFSSCKKATEGIDCNYNPCSFKAPLQQIKELDAYIATLKGAPDTSLIQHCSGMYYKILNTGAGKTPTVCSTVSVNYKGELTDGTPFDQTSTTPINLNLISLIEGWKQGLLLIKKGGKIKLYLPPALGYADNVAYGIIPANSILIFEIELVDVL